LTSEREEIQAERAELRKQYGVVFDKLSALFFRHDPIGISFENHSIAKDNPDEYEPEVGTILPRLEHCTSEAACLKAIHEEFCRWFGEDVAGPVAKHERIAHEAWIMWNDEKLN
jgi:hypothetical protein